MLKYEGERNIIFMCNLTELTTPRVTTGINSHPRKVYSILELLINQSSKIFKFLRIQNFSYAILINPLAIPELTP